MFFDAQIVFFRACLVILTNISSYVENPIEKKIYERGGFFQKGSLEISIEVINPL